MSGKDYYKILGIEKNASEDDIKKAFRTLAKKFHPDLHKGSKHHEEKFKEINEAYAVLSDAEKRRQYDAYGAEGFGQRFSQEDIFRHADFGNISDILSGLGFSDGFFSRMFRGGGGRGGPRVRFSSASPGMPFQGFPFGGTPGMEGSDPYSGFAGEPEEAQAELPLSLEEAFSGGKRTVSLREPDGRTSEVSFSVPSGVVEGQLIRLAEGRSRKRGAPMVVFKVHIRPHPMFRLEGKDLTVEREVPLTTLVLGGELEVPTLEGTLRRLKLKPGTPAFARLRIQGQGHGPSHSRGDLYVVITPRIPKTLTPAQNELFEQLQKSGI